MSNELRINSEIRARDVRVISPEGEQLGVMSVRDALQVAAEKELDLVEVAPNARPPVCRIMDYGKYRYEQTKRQKEAKKKQKVVTVKEVRMTPKIEEHDFQVKTKNAERFLKDGNKVKVSVRFRGREVVHSNLARDMLLQMVEEINHVAAVERQPMMEGRQMIMVLSPKQE
ncbi:MAG: translation initiation factor IF-3 [Firmicutes bacterium]|nr:translation initiation factor IF-3 [Bacillota bacterium]